MDWEEKLKDTPENEWPKFLLAAKKIGAKQGKTIQQALDEYDDRLKNSRYPTVDCLEMDDLKNLRLLGQLQHILKCPHCQVLIEISPSRPSLK